MVVKDDPKVVTAWTFYDWANSVYSLIITATIFPIYYENITHTENTDIVEFFGYHFINTSLYTYSVAFAFLLIASISPLLSGIADYSGNKKRFMQFFCYLGAFSCACMFFFTKETLSLGIFLVILACIGYSGSIVFYNAFLPEISSVEKQDRVSARGFAMGYLGSTILLIFNLAMVMRPEWFGSITANDAARISFVTVAIWWVLFAQIPFYYLPNQDHKNKITKDCLLNGYRELIQVWRILKKSTNLKRFLLAFFVYNMGVQTILLLATLFGKKEIGMGTDQLIITILIIQWVAMIGAYLFSYISTWKGNIFTLQVATLVYCIVCVDAFFIYSAEHFYFLAIMVGMVMGGIQALSRSTYSKMLPKTDDHASFFSFYDICEKVGIVLGMAMFGFVETATENMRYPIIFLSMFFFIGFLLLTRIPNDSQKVAESS